MFNNSVLRKSFHLRDNVDRFGTAEQADNVLLHMCVLCWIGEATRTHMHPPKRPCNPPTHARAKERTHAHVQINLNIYCFSTATMVMRTRLNVTLHVHGLSCYKIFRTNTNASQERPQTAKPVCNDKSHGPLSVCKGCSRDLSLRQRCWGRFCFVFG